MEKGAGQMGHSGERGFDNIFSCVFWFLNQVNGLTSQKVQLKTNQINKRIMRTEFIFLYIYLGGIIDCILQALHLDARDIKMSKTVAVPTILGNSDLDVMRPQHLFYCYLKTSKEKKKLKDFDTTDRYRNTLFPQS